MGAEAQIRLVGSHGGTIPHQVPPRVGIRGLCCNCEGESLLAVNSTVA